LGRVFKAPRVTMTDHRNENKKAGLSSKIPAFYNSLRIKLN